jgi:phosphate-selective porin OprO and OprP
MKQRKSSNACLLSALALLVSMTGTPFAWAQHADSKSAGPAGEPTAKRGGKEAKGPKEAKGHVDAKAKTPPAKGADAKDAEAAASKAAASKAAAKEAPAKGAGKQEQPGLEATHPAEKDTTSGAKHHAAATVAPKKPATAQDGVRSDRAEAVKLDKAAAAGATTKTDRVARAKADAKPVAKKKSNPLAPPEQAALLATHPVNNHKNTYKPGTGLVIASDDGKFSVGTRLRLQLRYSLAHDAEADPKLKHVFQLRRARLQFKGHTFGKHNKYKVEFAFSPRDLGMKNGVPHRTPLLTWYLEFDYLRDLTVRAGQYKIPYSRQRVVSSGDLQLVDRSIANGEFNHDRDIGFDLRSKDLFGLGGYVRYYAGVYMGEGRDFGDKNATPDFKLHYLARMEVLPLGPFKDYKEADMYRSVKPKLSLGGAYAFHHRSQGLRGVLGTTASDEGTTDYHSANVDYAFKYAGFSSTGEFHWRKGARQAGDATIEDPNDAAATLPAPVEAARNGVGWFVQAGYLFPRLPLELAARYSAIRGLGTADPGTLFDASGYTSLTQRDALGLGLSYYVAGHPWKIQSDYIRGWDDGDFGKANDLWRVQLQLAL